MHIGEQRLAEINSVLTDPDSESRQQTPGDREALRWFPCDQREGCRRSKAGNLSHAESKDLAHSSLIAEVSNLIRCFSIFARRVGRERPSIFAARDLFPPLRFRASVMSMAEN